VASHLVAIAGGVVLVGFGLWRALSKRHFRWAGMRLSALELAMWSFLMSSVHGAGLMLVPVLTADPPAPALHGSHLGHAGDAGGAPAGGLGDRLGGAAGEALAATGVHTLAMVAVAGVIAVVVYETIGVDILRKAWVNLDRVWAFVLVGAGVATVLAATI
jgi:hypothetical protein